MSSSWAHTDDYDIFYRETSDPRILEVIVRDEDAQLDGECYAPAYYVEYRDGYRNGGRLGSVYDDEDAMDAYINARAELGSHELAVRFMKIFHDTAVAERIKGDGTRIVQLNTPAWRVTVGLEQPDGTRTLNGNGEPIADEIFYALDWHDIDAYLDGDAWGVGHAVNEARVMHDAELIFEDFEIETESWGYFGEDYAKEACSEFNMPELPTLLELPA